MTDAITVRTTDTDLAAALMGRGAKLEAWEYLQDNGSKIRWILLNVDPQWVDDFRTGRDGVQRVMHARRMLLSIIKTDERKTT